MFPFDPGGKPDLFFVQHRLPTILYCPVLYSQDIQETIGHELTPIMRTGCAVPNKTNGNKLSTIGCLYTNLSAFRARTKVSWPPISREAPGAGVPSSQSRVRYYGMLEVVEEVEELAQQP